MRYQTQEPRLGARKAGNGWGHACIVLLALVASNFAHAQVQGAPEQQKGLGRDCVKPEWPKQSLIREEQGTVVIGFVVDVDGKVVETRVRKSSGFPLLDQAAQQAIERCRFTPEYVDGKPVQSSQYLQYVWTLDDGNLWQPTFPSYSGLNR